MRQPLSPSFPPIAPIDPMGENLVVQGRMADNAIDVSAVEIVCAANGGSCVEVTTTGRDEHLVLDAIVVQQGVILHSGHVDDGL